MGQSKNKLASEYLNSINRRSIKCLPFVSHDFSSCSICTCSIFISKCCQIVIIYLCNLLLKQYYCKTVMMSFTKNNQKLFKIYMKNLKSTFFSTLLRFCILLFMRIIYWFIISPVCVLLMVLFFNCYCFWYYIWFTICLWIYYVINC